MSRPDSPEQGGQILLNLDLQVGSWYVCHGSLQEFLLCILHSWTLLPQRAAGRDSGGSERETNIDVVSFYKNSCMANQADLLATSIARFCKSTVLRPVRPEGCGVGRCPRLPFVCCLANNVLGHSLSKAGTSSRCPCPQGHFSPLLM